MRAVPLETRKVEGSEATATFRKIEDYGNNDIDIGKVWRGGA